jgi:PKD domain
MKTHGLVLRTATAALATLAVLAFGRGGVALAAAPSITLGHTFSGSVSFQGTPTFTGTTNDILDPVTLKIYAGASATSGSPVQTLTSVPVPFKLFPPPSEATWSTAPGTPLKSGQYTARAEQTNPLTHTGASPAVTFTVDSTPPAVAITTPAANTILTVARPTISGVAGQAKGDRQSVSLTIYAGDSPTGSPVVPTFVLTPTGSQWTTGSAGPQLPNGIYTAVVSQSDELGNTGTSTVTFAISAPVGSAQAAPTSAAAAAASGSSPATPSSAPVASFQWFPAHPHTGEAVVLASTSTDSDSAISAFAWDLTGAGLFQSAGSALTTSFATPGTHVVRLRVTDAHGLSSVASETVLVSPAAPKLMAPYPVVRIADTVSFTRVKVSLLMVQAPVGATVTVQCRGRGCPTNSFDEVATSRRSKNRTGGLVLIAFRRFERALQAGTRLEIRVFQRGEVGKYTRFSARRGQLPVRVDTCLSPTQGTPISCPLS